MAEVIEFGKRAEGAKAAREEDLRRRKLEALRRVLQCSRCAHRCARCGVGIEGAELSAPPLPYVFCNTCREEYLEYRERAAGRGAGDPACYWRNEAWMRVWESWLDHQRRLEDYRRSGEFLRLMAEAERLLGRDT